MTPRRPERDLEVLWQRHIPGGYKPDTEEGEGQRAVALADLGEAVSGALLTEIGDAALDSGDLVVTISRRPLKDGGSGVRERRRPPRPSGRGSAEVVE